MVNRSLLYVAYMINVFNLNLFFCPHIGFLDPSTIFVYHLYYIHRSSFIFKDMSISLEEKYEIVLRETTREFSESNAVDIGRRLQSVDDNGGSN